MSDFSITYISKVCCRDHEHRFADSVKIKVVLFQKYIMGILSCSFVYKVRAEKLFILYLIKYKISIQKAAIFLDELVDMSSNQINEPVWDGLCLEAELVQNIPFLDVVCHLAACTITECVIARFKLFLKQSSFLPIKELSVFVTMQLRDESVNDLNIFHFAM